MDGTVGVVQIEIETADKTGTFLGSLWEGKENVSIGLLEAGLAKLHPSFSTDRVTEGHLLVRAEESAKKKKLKVGGVLGELGAMLSHVGSWVRKQWSFDSGLFVEY
jgi:hypothetical protein